MKNKKRIFWNLRTGLAGGHFLAAEGIEYFLGLYQTPLGTRCDILGPDLIPIKTKLKITYAKRLVKRWVKNEG
jgi:hypothetical protein